MLFVIRPWMVILIIQKHIEHHKIWVLQSPPDLNKNNAYAMKLFCGILTHLNRKFEAFLEIIKIYWK